MHWLRRSFITGFFVTVPLFISVAAFSHDLLEVRHHLGRARALEIAVGFVMAFISSALVVRPFLAIYVPTNHLYLGDIVICERDRATFPDVTVEEGIRVFLTGGMALPLRLRGWSGDDRVKDFRV